MEAAADIRYKRLTRAVARAGFAVASRSRGSLWLGPDHVLCVESNGYAETYKRFYFRDIQAIIIQKSSRRAIYNAILAVPILGCLIGLLACLTAFSENEAAVIAWSIILGMFLLILLINSLLGAGCVTYLRTAVQIERLPSLCRVTKTQRVLDHIRPLIAAAQGGELSAETVSSRMRESVEHTTATTIVPTTAENSNKPAAPDV